MRSLRIAVATAASLSMVALGCTSDEAAPPASTTTDSPTTTILSADDGDVGLQIDIASFGAPLGLFDPVIYNLDVGACFFLIPITTGQTLSEYVTGPTCDAPHEHEMYFTIEHPAGPDERFPGEDAMRQWALRRCYEQFEPFVGQIYELSTLEIGYSLPPREYWEDSARRFRRVSCWVGRSDGEPLEGSVRGSGI